LKWTLVDTLFVSGAAVHGFTLTPIQNRCTFIKLSLFACWTCRTSVSSSWTDRTVERSRTGREQMFGGWSQHCHECTTPALAPRNASYRSCVRSHDILKSTSRSFAVEWESLPAIRTWRDTGGGRWGPRGAANLIKAKICSQIISFFCFERLRCELNVVLFLTDLCKIFFAGNHRWFWLDTGVSICSLICKCFH
jgi:hypothetical protein